MAETILPSLRTRSLRVLRQAMRIGLLLALCRMAEGGFAEEREPTDLNPRAWADRSCLVQNPEAPIVNGWNVKTGSSAGASAGTGAVDLALSGQSYGLNFTAITYADTLENPPSPSGAAGPTEFLLGVNRHVRCFDKATGAIGALDCQLETFFAPVLDGGGVKDVRVKYDRFSQRWFVLAANYYPGLSGSFLAPNRILIAVSGGPSITASTSWTLFSFRQDEVLPAGDSNCMVDAPSLGLDANALYIGANLLCGIGTPGYHGGSVAFVVRKSSLLSGGPIVVSAFRDLCNGSFGSGPYAPQGADNLDPGATQGYIIGVDNEYFGMLTLRRIENPAGTPSISGNITLTVPVTYLPPTVPHRGNNAGANGNLNAVDDRLAAVHIRGGRLWATHSIGVNAGGTAVAPVTRVGIRWYEVGDLDSTPKLVRSGTIYDSAASNPLSYWTASLMSAGADRTGFGFNIAGAESYVDAGVASLLAGGSMVAPERFTSTDSAFNPDYDAGGSKGRPWGTGSSTSVDPTDDATLWTVQEFPASSSTWGVRVAELLGPAPLLDDRLYHACQGHTGWTLTLTGQYFHDPGPGFNRPGTVVSGQGVTVQSTTVVDSNHLSVSLHITSSAALVAHDIIYTNPDGQTSTLYNALLVHGGRADLDGDCHVDAADAILFEACSTGPSLLYDTHALPQGCQLPLTPSGHLTADFDDDFDVDVRDFALFQRCFTGAEGYIEPNSECLWGYP